jgi:hypothetical protein
MSSKGNPNKQVYTDVEQQYLAITGKQVEVQGGRVRTLLIVDGNLKLSGELELGQVIVVNPTAGDGTPDNGLYLSGATGVIGSVSTYGTKRDHGKIGSGTHDLVIGTWLGRCWPPDPTPAGQEPVHRDGLQVSSALRVTLGFFDFRNQFPGATNGGIWINPQKSGGQVDPNDPTLIQDFVVEGGRIENPNAAIHLGACTRCGARNTLLVAKRPLRLKDTAVDVIDEGNTKIVVEP